MYIFTLLLVRAGEYLHLVGHHERRVESQTEVSDYGLILILGQKLLGTREGYLIDITVDLLGRHTDTAIGDSKGLGRRIDTDMYGQIAQLTAELALRGQRLEFLRSIHSVRNQLTKENLMIRIEEFFDDGEYVFRRHSDFTVFHRLSVFLIYFCTYHEQSMCHRPAGDILAHAGQTWQTS